MGEKSYLWLCGLKLFSSKHFFVWVKTYLELKWIISKNRVKNYLVTLRNKSIWMSCLKCHILSRYSMQQLSKNMAEWQDLKDLQAQDLRLRVGTIGCRWVTERVDFLRFLPMRPYKDLTGLEKEGKAKVIETQWCLFEVHVKTENGGWGI